MVFYQKSLVDNISESMGVVWAWLTHIRTQTICCQTYHSSKMLLQIYIFFKNISTTFSYFYKFLFDVNPFCFPFLFHWQRFWIYFDTYILGFDWKQEWVPEDVYPGSFPCRQIPLLETAVTARPPSICSYWPSFPSMYTSPLPPSLLLYNNTLLRGTTK